MVHTELSEQDLALQALNVSWCRCSDNLLHFRSERKHQRQARSPRERLPLLFPTVRVQVPSALALSDPCVQSCPVTALCVRFPGLPYWRPTDENSSKRQKFILGQFERLEIQNQGVGKTRMSLKDQGICFSDTCWQPSASLACRPFTPVNPCSWFHTDLPASSYGCLPLYLLVSPYHDTPKTTS